MLFPPSSGSNLRALDALTKFLTDCLLTSVILRLPCVAIQLLCDRMYCLLFISDWCVVLLVIAFHLDSRVLKVPYSAVALSPDSEAPLSNNKTLLRGSYLPHFPDAIISCCAAYVAPPRSASPSRPPPSA